MTKRSLPVMMLLAGCLRGGPKTPVATDSTADRAAIERVLVDWYRAIETHDSAGVAAPLLPSFFIFEDTTRIERDALIAGVVAGFPSGSQTARLTGLATEVRGDVAWTSFRNDEVWTPSDGSRPDTLRFLESVVFERRNGAWMMERYHATRINRPGR